MAKYFDEPKAPDEVRDYGVNWYKDLGGATIDFSEWEVISGHVAVDADGHSETSTVVRLSGGQADETCTLKNTVTLSNGEITSVTCHLLIRAK